MKKMLLILGIFPYLLTAQTIQKDTIVFTEIVLEEVDGHSAYLAYKDSDGEEKFDLVFESEDIFVDGKLLFDFDMGLCEKFDEEFANELTGKAVLLEYYMKESKYFGMQKYVKTLTILNGVEVSFDLENEVSEEVKELPFSFYCETGPPNGKSTYNQNGINGVCEFNNEGEIIKFSGEVGSLGGPFWVKYHRGNYEEMSNGVWIQENKKKPSKEFKETMYYFNGQLAYTQWYVAGEYDFKSPKDGKSVVYDLEGNEFVKGQYLNGQKQGTWTTTDNKTFILTEVFENGKKTKSDIQKIN